MSKFRRSSWGDKPYKKDMDWLRACQKREWDNRPMNPARHILDYCLQGFTVNHSTHLHYDEPKERY